MRRLTLLLLTLMLAGCGGGSAGSRLAPGQPAPAQPPATGQPEAPAGPIHLTLSATPEGGNMRLMLAARDATDLYQIAGALSYDPARYDLLNVEAGGGLGGPEDCYFVGGEAVQGRVAFAYTKRWYGAGAQGGVNLLSVVVAPKRGFSLADFSVDTGLGQLLLRNSAKQAFAPVVEVAQ